MVSLHGVVTAQGAVYKAAARVTLVSLLLCHVNGDPELYSFTGSAPLNQATTELRLENYRPYLRLLAQTQLQMRVVLRRKVNASDIVQEVLMQAIVAQT